MTDMDEGFTDFTCGNCHTEIQATLDMVGQETECPACGARIRIPEPKDGGLVRHGLADFDPDSIQAMKSRTIRIELGDV